MSVTLSDQDIARLIQEKKLLPEDHSARKELRAKSGHRERNLDVDGADGSEFRVIVRQSSFNPLDFSAILAYRPRQSSQLFRLRRYNGKSHEHTNPIEGTSFYDYHVHEATERYQETGGREDTYAEPTSRFSDIHGAISCMFCDCAFDIPGDAQGQLSLEV